MRELDCPQLWRFFQTDRPYIHVHPLPHSDADQSNPQKLETTPQTSGSSNNRNYDVRGPYITRPKHWRGENLEARALFQRITNPSSLNMDNVSEADEGEYRCRIDYLKSPTKNLRVRLDVIVPPNKPKIYDVNGTEVGDHAGPYEEGGDMKLQCVVSGGKPMPTIRWWREDKLIQTSTTTRNRDLTNRLANQLIVRGLKRTDQHVKFTCEASNHNYSLPVRSSTSIDIYFRPLDVEILSSNQPFSADRKYEIPCQTFGSRPPANITWSILEMRRELRPPKYNITENIAEDRNSTSSLLTFIPSKEDNGRTLVCRASNLNVKNGVIETSLQLNVYYIPRIQLLLGSSLNPDDIEEGDDVYFECQVDANPSAYKVVWKHNNQVLQARPGIIMSNENLALQAVTRSQAGNYSCVGSNVEGDGDSNIINLKIMYKPICRTHQKRVYGVARHEESRILCEVESYPPPDRFSWSFNNSAEVMEVPQERYNSTIHHFTSILTYTPVTELDYGTVMCWGNNLAGRQQEPCIFHIIAAGKPDPLYNCSIVNRTNDSLEVECTEGFDGGQPQYFLLEVYERKSGVLQANVSAKFPLFIVSGLDPGKELKMAVYAANAKGRSEPVLLEGFTLKVAEKQTVLSLGTRDQIEIAPVLGVLVGIVTAVLLVTVVILLALKIRRSRRNACRALRPRFLPVKDKVTLPLRSESEDLFEKDDKNPDVVPSNKDSDYQLGSAAQTPGLNNSALSVSGNPADFGRNVAGSPPASAAASPSAPLQNVTPLAEAYMARNRNFTSPNNATNNEVVYAELQLARPNSLDPIKNGGQHFASGQQYATLRKGDDSTIYTQIDHGRRPPPPPVPNSRTSPIVSPVTAAIFPTSKQGLYHREVVTVRTPLMGCQQESCV